jgi:Transketolase
VTLHAAEALAAKGKKVRVVSMPSTSVFDQQDAAYKESVLPLSVLARVAVETAHVDYWYKYVGLDGRVVGMTSFGESAPGPVLMEHFGFTVDNIVATVEELL